MRHLNGKKCEGEWSNKNTHRLRFTFFFIKDEKINKI